MDPPILALRKGEPFFHKDFDILVLVSLNYPRHFRKRFINFSKFIEVEDSDGKSISIGEWVTRDDGLAALRVFDFRRGEVSTVEGLEQRHKFLHRCVDELFACYIESNPDQVEFLKSSLGDFLEWSFKMTTDPTCVNKHIKKVEDDDG